MPFSEYGEFLEQSPNKRTDFLDENADFDTYLYNNGNPPDQIALMRNTSYSNDLYATNSNNVNSHKMPRYPGNKKPPSQVNAAARTLYRPKDVSEVLTTPFPKGQSDEAWVGARPPHIPAYKQPSGIPANMRPDPNIARQYHEKAEQVEELERKIAGKIMQINHKKRHSRHPLSHFQEDYKEIEELKRQRDACRKEDGALRRQSNRQVEAMRRHVDYGHWKAAEVVPYEGYFVDGRQNKEERKKSAKYRYR